jgi:hypothetical protein
MTNDQRKMTMAIGAAVLAGTVAAGVAYVLHIRPQWRRHIVEAGRHLLNVAEGMLWRSTERGEIERR